MADKTNDTRYEKEKAVEDKKQIAARKRKITAELKRLNKVFETIDKDTYAVIEPLIHDAAFLGITLKELKDEIVVSGMVVNYQNGKNQWGTKKSPYVDSYNTFLKQYRDIVKQLVALLPDQNNNAGLPQDLQILIGGKPK